MYLYINNFVPTFFDFVVHPRNGPETVVKVVFMSVQSRGSS